jgi:hypothetical protein
MTIRDWVMAKLAEEQLYDIEPHGHRGLIIRRDDEPDAHVLCPEASDSELFTSDDLGAALAEMPDLDFVVIVRRRVANDVYALADVQGVAIGGLYLLKSALEEVPRIGRYVTKEQGFVRSRLAGNQYVERFSRLGESAYEILRTGSRPPLVAITIRHYELTSDEVFSLLEECDSAQVDAIVTTNPNCHGFSPTTLSAARNAGVRIMTFRDFLDSLRESSWS